MPENPADCGATYNHGAHTYRTPLGKIKVCDGDRKKRLQQPDKPFPKKKRT